MLLREYKICETCARGYARPRKISDDQWHWRRFCSVSCKHKGLKKDPVECFWAKVDRRSEDECWEWTGYRLRQGYGRMLVNRQGVLAHRFSYELHVGPVPEGLELDHLCRNQGCVNPAHLEPVTHQENCRRAYLTTKERVA